MIVPDVNLLIYAYDTTCLEHKPSKAWLEDSFSGDEPVGIPWQCLSAFLRIMTDPRIPGQRFTMQQALGVVEQWIALPGVRALSQGESHWPIFRDMLIQGDIRGRLTSDAALAALTIEFGAVLYTADHDFARFPGLRWVNPLLGA